MSELTWYVLDELEEFLEKLKAYSRARKKPTYLVYLLTTYAQGEQKYGTEYFTDLEGILSYFGLTYLEYGQVFSAKPNHTHSHGTYFIAKI